MGLSSKPCSSALQPGESKYLHKSTFVWDKKLTDEKLIKMIWVTHWIKKQQKNGRGKEKTREKGGESAFVTVEIFVIDWFVKALRPFSKRLISFFSGAFALPSYQLTNWSLHASYITVSWPEPHE